MNYQLMHKNVPVFEINLDEDTGIVFQIGAISDSNHIPIGIPFKKGIVDKSSFASWWKGRAIPASRQGLQDSLDILEVTSEVLVAKALALSLSDHYWIRPINSSISWESVNFFDNEFSEDIGNSLFGAVLPDVNFTSPDNTSDGWLKKRWKILDGTRYLIKGGSKPYHQEPFNEKIASLICQKLGLHYVPYELVFDNAEEFSEKIPYSICPNFLDGAIELIPAWNIYLTGKKDNHVSYYDQYLRCAENLNAPSMIQAIDQMLILDFLIANTDRHMRNFGVLRNADSLQILGATPIFDSGTSLWCDVETQKIKISEDSKCKPFRSHHLDQIKFVTSFDSFDPQKLDGIESEVFECFAQSSMTEDRISRISRGIRKRIDMLSEIANSKHPHP